MLVEAHAGDRVGLGYTYGDAAAGALVRDTLAEVVEGRDALAVTASWQALGRACRNLGRPGLASMAIAAVDTALWDLKARLLELPLATLLDAAHEAVPIYGSGGFTSYSDERLAEQLGGWAEQGIPRVKMKVGREPERDLHRVEVAREAIGEETELYVDANGALSRKEALAVRRRVRGALRRALVRGAGQLGRPGRPAPAPRPGAGGDGDRRRRVRLHAALLRADARGGCRRLPAGGRHSLRGDHRLPARRRSLSGALAPALGALRAFDPRPSRAARSCRCATSNTSTTTRGSSRSSSTASSSPVGGELRPDLSRPGNGLELKRADAATYAI